MIDNTQISEQTYDYLIPSHSQRHSSGGCILTCLLFIKFLGTYLSWEAYISVTGSFPFMGVYTLLNVIHWLPHVRTSDEDPTKFSHRGDSIKSVIVCLFQIHSQPKQLIRVHFITDLSVESVRCLQYSSNRACTQMTSSGFGIIKLHPRWPVRGCSYRWGITLWSSCMRSIHRCDQRGEAVAGAFGVVIR